MLGGRLALALSIAAAALVLVAAASPPSTKKSKRTFDKNAPVRIAPAGPKTEAGGSSGSKATLADLPAYRKARFYDVEVEGKFIVFVVDSSGSMDAEFRLGRAKREVLATVGRMTFPQRFHVVFYHEEARSLPFGPCPANETNRQRLAHWMRQVPADGATDPRDALREALTLEPDAIFLVSDGEYPDGVAAEVIASNRDKVPIHCVDLSGGAAGIDLERIARASGGTYAARP